MDVNGKMLGQDYGKNNQDFLMINTPEFAFANVRGYRRLNSILDLPEMVYPQTVPPLTIDKRLTNAYTVRGISDKWI